MNKVAAENRPASNGSAVASACSTVTLRAGQPPGQGAGQPLIDLHGGQPGHLAAQHVGGQARSWPHFQHLVAEVGLREHPGQQLGLDERRPLRAGTDPQVRFIHAVILAQPDPGIARQPASAREHQDHQHRGRAQLDDRAEHVAGHPAEPPPGGPGGAGPPPPGPPPPPQRPGPRPPPRPGPARPRPPRPAVPPRWPPGPRRWSARPPGRRTRTAGPMASRWPAPPPPGWSPRPAPARTPPSSRPVQPRGTEASALTWTSSTSTSVATPSGPASDRRMISRAWSAGRRLPSPSAVSASPSRCRPPVATASSATARAAPSNCRSGGQSTRRNENHHGRPGQAQQPAPRTGSQNTARAAAPSSRSAADPGRDHREQAQRHPPGRGPGAGGGGGAAFPGGRPPRSPQPPGDPGGAQPDLLALARRSWC